MHDTNLVEIIGSRAEITTLYCGWFSDGWFTDNNDLAVVPTPFFIDCIWIKFTGHKLRQAGYRLIDNVLVVPISVVRKHLDNEV